MATNKIEKTAEKYCLSALRANCNELLGVSTSTFDGAFYGKSENMTVEEAKKNSQLFFE